MINTRNRVHDVRQRRRPARMLAGAVAALVAVAGGALPATASTVRHSSDVVHLTYWTGWSGLWATRVQDQVDEFNKTHPDIQVSVLSTPSNSYTKLLAAIAAGDPPNVYADLTAQGPAELAAKGAVVPLTKFMTGKYKGFASWLYPIAKDYVQYKGQLYGVPMYFDVYLLYYNKGMMQKAGLNPNDPPSTLTEFEADQAKEWKASGSSVSQMGFYPYAAGDNAQYLTAAFGDLSFYNGGKWDFTGNQDARNMFDFLASFKKYPYSTSTGLITAVTPEGGSVDAFDIGKIGFWISGLWEISQIEEATPAIKWGVEPLPGSASSAYFDMNLDEIPKGATHQSAAFDFLTWMTGYDNTSYRAKSVQLYGQPSSPAVVGNSTYQKYLDAVPARREFIKVLSNTDDPSIPRTCVAPEYMTDLDTVVESVEAGKMTASAGLASMQKSMDAAQC